MNLPSLPSLPTLPAVETPVAPEKPPGASVETLELTVEGMHCASCVARIEGALRKVSGVVSASVDLLSGHVIVGLSSPHVKPGTLVAAIEETGYRAEVREAAELARAVEGFVDEEQLERAMRLDRLTKQVVVAAVIALPVTILSMLDIQFPDRDVIFLAATALVLGFSGHEFFSKGLGAIFRLSPDMNTLIALGTGTAFLISTLATLAPELFHATGAHAPVYFEAAAVIIAFVLLGRLLEEKAREKAGESIRKLAGLAARKARIVRNGVEEEMPANGVRKGDVLRVLPGEKFPADGVILEGFTAADESMVTGESIPVEKKKGDPVIGATLNGTGSILMRATRVGAETALSQIVRLVREARMTKAPIQRLADRVAAVFVPVVAVIALAAFAVWYFAGPEPRLIRALTAATSVLIVACPCALGLATPAALLVGIGRGAEKGILIKNAEALEKAGRIRAIVFDKTGTLTEGRPEVESLLPAPGRTKEEFLSSLAALERHSEHPLARAVLKHADSAKLRPVAVKDAVAQPGGGIRGMVEGSVIVAGSADFVSGTGVVIPADHLEKATDSTALFAAVGGRYLGAVFFSDPLKPDVPAEMEKLADRGLSLYLLSGDRPEVARRLAREAGLSEENTVAGVKPEGKAAFIDELRGKGIEAAMAGDGINDAPALARATVGIAMGTGTDVAMAASDITLVGGSIRGVRKALELADATRKILFQNLALAFVYNILLIPVAAGVLYPVLGVTMNPMLAGGAMALSSVSVVTNALRLRRSPV